MNALCHCCLEPSLEPGSRLHKPDDGRPDFMSTPGSAGRMDGTPMKQVSGWESSDEATRIKSSMMAREKMVSLVFLFMDAFAVLCSIYKLKHVL